MRCFSLPAYEQGTKPIVPAIGPLDDPAPRLSSDHSYEWWLTTTADMRNDSARANSCSDIVVVIALVEAAMLGASRSPSPSHDNGIQHGLRHPLVMDVRATEHDPQRDAIAIGQEMTLGTRLAAIRGVSARGIPLLAP
jgi:hypothetical protein